MIHFFSLNLFLLVFKVFFMWTLVIINNLCFDILSWFVLQILIFFKFLHIFFISRQYISIEFPAFYIPLLPYLFFLSSYLRKSLYLRYGKLKLTFWMSYNDQNNQSLKTIKLEIQRCFLIEITIVPFTDFYANQAYFVFMLFYTLKVHYVISFAVIA